MKFPSFVRQVLVSLCMVIMIAAKAGAAAVEPEPDPGDLPRVAAVEPRNALETFQIKPGFGLELVAAEPLVVDPIALSFDENGRMFVVEMRDYSERRDEHLGRIRLLEDTNGDGRFDKSTVFAENLAWPTAVVCYGGGIFVGMTPDILYLKDTDGDGVADVRETVFTGFGIGVQRLNVQQLLNSFTWALDNRIHGANGGNGGTITAPGHPGEKPLELRGRDFSFDPRTRTMRAESGGGQYGLSFDDAGHKFICSNSSHIREVMYEDRYVARNPLLAMPPPSIDIAVDGPAAEVYRISPEEPWRVIRTKWRVAGLVPGPIEGGGRASGYFTSATGITIYRGDAWPEEYRGNAFIADCGSNLVHRKRVLPNGVGFKAERAPGEEKVEFLASRDLWFRPVQMANAPDGTLYVIDMYREVIEHPWSFPASIKKHLDLNSGNDRGRIYRVVPDQFQQRPLPQLETASNQELVRILEHANGWHRDTSARLLYERQDRSVVPELKRLTASSKSPLGRLHALYVLHGLGSLSGEDVGAALQDESALVRRHALRLLEQLPAGQSVATEETLQRLATDPSPEVRYHLAYTLGSLNRADILKPLQRLLDSDAADSWMRLAVLNSVGDRALELFVKLLPQDRLMAGAQGAKSGAASHLDPFLRQLVALLGARLQKEEVNRVLDLLGKLESPAQACVLASALSEGIQRSGRTLGHFVEQTRLENLVQGALSLLQNSQAPEQSKLAAVRLLGQGQFPLVRESLRSMLQPSQPTGLQKAAVDSLASFAEPDSAQDLLSAWSGLTPTLRAQVVETLLRRPERCARLLGALESGELRRADLSASQTEFLRKHLDPALRERAGRILGQAPSSSRQEAVRAFAGALRLSGDPERGRKIYLERCASCHRLAGQGHAFGPDLETVRANGREMLLGNLLDPNREVTPKYVNYLAETQDGESLTGLVTMESDTTVVLRQANDREVTLLRSNLTQFRSLGQSAMPEGLEEGLAVQDLADLMEYVLSAR